MSLNTILATAPLTTTNFVLKATGTTIGNSLIFDNGTNVGIGNTNTSYKLDVSGTGNFSSTAYTNLTVNGTNATGWGNNIAFKSVGTDFGYIGSIGSLLGNTTKDMAIWATAGNGFSVYTNGNNQRMTITSAGHVGIDVVPSNWQYSVVGGILQVGNSSIYEYGNYEVGLQVNCYYNSGWKYIASGSTTSTQIQLNDGNILFNNAVAGTAGNAITFTERMRITSGGNVCVNTTSTNASGLISINANVDLHQGIAIKSIGSQNGLYYVYFMNTSGGAAGAIAQTSSTTVNYGASSDYRLKEDLQDFNGLDKVSSIKVYDFKWKDDDRRDYGAMAHELQQVVPNSVVGQKDEINQDGTIRTQQVDYSKLVPVLVKAIQEMNTKIEELSKQNEELSNRLIKLESK